MFYSIVTNFGKNLGALSQHKGITTWSEVPRHSEGEYFEILQIQSEDSELLNILLQQYYNSI